MTMPKAILLLVFSGLLMVVGVVLIFLRVDQGLIDSSIDSRNSGARSGEQRATPTGSRGVAAIEAERVLTSTAATITAVAPTPGAAQTLAARTPVPNDRGAAVAVGEPIDVRNSRYTVHQVADPEAPGFFATQPGNRRVALEITETALSGTVTYSFAKFRIRDVEGKEHSWAIANTTPKFETGTLKAGESRRGWISFQVPSTVRIDALVLIVTGQSQGVPIVDLR